VLLPSSAELATLVQKPTTSATWRKCGCHSACFPRPSQLRRSSMGCRLGGRRSSRRIAPRGRAFVPPETTLWAGVSDLEARLLWSGLKC
jgi:hypothetical protein